MAKKTKRVQRKKASVRQSRTQAVTGKPSQPQPAPIPSRPTVVPTATAPARVDLAQEYHYVFADLKKIAIIAVAMFVLLFVLAFLLR